MKLNHIRKDLVFLEKQIKSRGYKDDVVILAMFRILTRLLKEVEKLQKEE